MLQVLDTKKLQEASTIAAVATAHKVQAATEILNFMILLEPKS